MFKRLLKRRKRSAWTTLLPTLTWWRVRYGDSAQATRGLHAIAAHLPNKLIALAVQADPLPMLWLGLPMGQTWCMEALQPYGVWLHAATSEPNETVLAFISTAVTRWQPIAHWPSAPTWTGLLASGQLYVEADDDEDVSSEAVAWPASNGQHPATWQLPTAVLGMAAQLPPVAVQPLPVPLSADNAGIYVGYHHNQPVYAPERVQVWGDSHALHQWTIQLILHQLTNLTSPLVVIDGRGDMAAQLPLYKPFVAALKGEQLHYVHFEDDLRRQGFNPLQPLAWETAAQTADRWQRWLAALGIWPSGVLLDTQTLCLQAVHNNIDTLSSLIRWLQHAPNLPQTASVHIQRALRQVEQSHSYASWLRRPTSLFERPRGLVFACALGTDTVRHTMTAALLDVALTMPAVTLVLTGVPTTVLQAILTERFPHRVVMVNGVRLDGGLVGIGRISNANKRQQMVQRAFRESNSSSLVEIHERLTISPADSLFWLTDPPIQTTT